jgi:hypothetical protein
MPVDVVDRRVTAAFRGKMRYDLVTEEIEVDPLVAAASFGAAEQAAIERARFGQIANRKGEVEWAQGHGNALSAAIFSRKAFSLDSFAMNA